MRRFLPLGVVVLMVGCGPGESPDTDQAPAPSIRQGQAISFDGVPIAYTVAGEGQGALLFIHGLMCDRNYWEGQLEPFAEGQKVVAVDLAGHGDSGLGRKEWTIESLGRDVVAVADALELDTMVLIGHSLGGPVALEVARLIPERVVGIIGVDTMHNYEFEWPEGWDEQLAAFETDFVTTCETFVNSMFLDSADPGLVAEVRVDMCASPPAVAVALLHTFEDYDYPAAASAAAAVPIRCINSAAYSTEVEINRAYTPDFDVRLMEGVGHFPMLERTDEFNRLLDRTIEELTAGATT